MSRVTGYGGYVQMNRRGWSGGDGLNGSPPCSEIQAV